MCKDPALTYLNDLGYNVIRYPRATVSPLYLLGRRDGTIEGLGTLDKLLKSRPNQQVKPSISRSDNCPGIDGRMTSDLSATVGLGILSAFLKATGAELDVSTHFNMVRSLKFSFAGVRLERAELLDIGKFLDEAEADMGNPVVRTYLKPGGKLYVIHEVLKSSQLGVVLDPSTRADVELKLPLLQKSLDGKAGVDVKMERHVEMNFVGRTPLAFGFKCMEIFLKVEDGQALFEMTPVKPGPNIHFSPSGDDATAPLLVADDLIELHDFVGQ